MEQGSMEATILPQPIKTSLLFIFLFWKEKWVGLKHADFAYRVFYMFYLSTNPSESRKGVVFLSTVPAVFWWTFGVICKVFKKWVAESHWEIWRLAWTTDELNWNSCFWKQGSRFAKKIVDFYLLSCCSVALKIASKMFFDEITSIWNRVCELVQTRWLQLPLFTIWFAFSFSS